MNPQKALNLLRQYHTDIQVIGGKLVELRKQYVLVEAGLNGAEGAALTEYFEKKPCRISEQSAWVKHKIWVERCEEAKLKSQIRAMETEWDVLIEALNVLKASIRLTELEIKNLSLT